MTCLLSSCPCWPRKPPPSSTARPSPAPCKATRAQASRCNRSSFACSLHVPHFVCCLHAARGCAGDLGTGEAWVLACLCNMTPVLHGDLGQYAMQGMVMLQECVPQV